MHAEEIGILLKQERGQFLEFLSAYEYRRGGTQKKKDEELGREIVRVLSGMANADGGTLLVGVEPDRSVTGVPHEPNEVQSLIQAPQTLLTPPLSLASAKIRLGNLLLIKFEVASARVLRDRAEITGHVTPLNPVRPRRPGARGLPRPATAQARVAGWSTTNSRRIEVPDRRSPPQRATALTRRALRRPEPRALLAAPRSRPSGR